MPAITRGRGLQVSLATEWGKLKCGHRKEREDARGNETKRAREQEGNKEGEGEEEGVGIWG